MANQNKIIDAIKTLYEAEINIWSDAMVHVFDYIAELEKQEPEEKGQVVSKKRIKDEITLLITRYINDWWSRNDTVSDLIDRIKDDSK